MNKEYRSIYKPNALKHLSLDYLSIANHELFNKHPMYMNLKVSLKDRFLSIALFAYAYLKQLFRRLIMYEMIPYHLRKSKSLTDILKLTSIAFQHSIFRRKLFSYSTNITIDDSKKSDFDIQKFKSDGCIVKTLPEDDLKLLNDVSDQSFKFLAHRRHANKSQDRQFTDSRLQLSRTEDPEVFKVIESIFNNSGIFSLVKEHAGRDVSLIDVTPQINDETDNFWQKIFDDQQTNIPSTSYIHRDASGGDIKIIIYLSDVDKTNGPFSYIVGSHKFKSSFFSELIAETNDTNGFTSTNIDNRKKFFSLPHPLKRKCTIGNDIDNLHDLSSALLSSEWPILGKQGSMVIFNPKGLHRGGLLQGGSRKVITCVLG